MKSTPQQLLLGLSLIALLAVFNSVYFALQAPMLGLSFKAHDKGFQITHIAPDSPNRSQLRIGQVVTEINGIPMTPDLLIEEPDQLNEWTAYNDFLDKMTLLNDAANRQSLQARTEQGESISLTVRERHITDLPPLFWFQAFVGVCGFLIAASVFAFRQQDKGALYFALAGLGLLCVFAGGIGLQLARIHYRRPNHSLVFLRQSNGRHLFCRLSGCLIGVLP
ncbi:hypothetical protein [Thiomicrorhabdus sp.]|uniref:PDZ domain-containing protein n=1 Tax=Thiomicrorhabdus sp. TaxID=2039724 RepID=UPI0029C94356|nr:hypothetical protein [Thiomicrorhabdus sp.]